MSARIFLDWQVLDPHEGLSVLDAGSYLCDNFGQYAGQVLHILIMEMLINYFINTFYMVK